MHKDREARHLFIVGVRNAHAMEKQALSILTPQVKRLEHYPDVSARLEQHVAETEGHIDRLDRILGRLDTDSSGFKDAVLSAMGGLASLSHATAGDEILKNSFANFAFEHYEIAAYSSLTELARASGETADIGLIEQNLEEERAMASWLEQNLAAVTRRFVSLTEQGEKADV